MYKTKSLKQVVKVLLSTMTPGAGVLLLGVKILKLDKRKVKIYKENLISNKTRHAKYICISRLIIDSLLFYGNI